MHAGAARKQHTFCLRCGALLWLGLGLGLLWVFWLEDDDHYSQSPPYLALHHTMAHPVAGYELEPWALHGVCCGPVRSCSSHPAKTRAIPSTCDLLPLIKNTRQPTSPLTPCHAMHMHGTCTALLPPPRSPSLSCLPILSASTRLDSTGRHCRRHPRWPLHPPILPVLPTTAFTTTTPTLTHTHTHTHTHSHTPKPTPPPSLPDSRCAPQSCHPSIPPSALCYRAAPLMHRSFSSWSPVH